MLLKVISTTYTFQIVYYIDYSIAKNNLAKICNKIGKIGMN